MRDKGFRENYPQTPFISFRDTTHESATKGDWVGWVGTYQDIVGGREGQYRVRLMKNHQWILYQYGRISLSCLLPFGIRPIFEPKNKIQSRRNNA